MVCDLRSTIRVAQGRQGQPGAVILNGRTLQSTCERGPRAGYDGYERKRSSKVHIAIDTLRQLLAVHVTPANEQERAQMADLARQVQQVTGYTVEVASADQGYAVEEAAQVVRDEGIELQVIKPEEAKNGFVLLHRRWVVERSFGWLNRFLRLARDYACASRKPRNKVQRGFRAAVQALHEREHALTTGRHLARRRQLTPQKTTGL